MEITIAKNGKTIGPFDENQVADMLKSGMLVLADLWWVEGMVEWKLLVLNGIELDGKIYSAGELAEVNSSDLLALRQQRNDPRPYLILENRTIEFSLTPAMYGNLTRPAFKPILKSENRLSSPY